mgnify:CR=1 FL=1
MGALAGHFTHYGIDKDFIKAAREKVTEGTSAVFLMTEDAVAYLDTSEGFEIGVGPSFVVVDEGMASSLTTTTAKKDIYAFFFDQGGLMAGLGLQGSKISPINPE